MADQEKEMEKIEKRLSSLEDRLSRLESVLISADNTNLKKSGVLAQTPDLLPVLDSLNEESRGLESQIGRVGLALLGNIVLLFGITFLTEYLMILGHRIFSVFLGYVAVGAILALANYLKKSNEQLAFMFKMNSQILLFYVTLRLHFFSASPILSHKTISVIFILLIIALQVYLSLRYKSQAFAALSLIFTLIAAFVVDATHFTLPLVTMTALGSWFYYYKFNWSPLLIIYNIFYLCLIFPMGDGESCYGTYNATGRISALRCHLPFRTGIMFLCFIAIQKARWLFR